MEVTELALLVGAAGRSTLDEAAVLVTAAPLVVRPGQESPARLVSGAAATLRTAPTVTVVVGDPATTHPDLADAADVCVTDTCDPPRPWVTASVESVARSVRSAPQAALALVSLLRSTEHLSVEHAIAAEAATYAALLGSSAHQRWLAERGPTTPRPHTRAPVGIVRDGHRLSIRLDRPEARNAVDTATRDALVAALDVVHADPTISEVDLSGAGPAFCAGGDLDEFGTTTDPATALAVRLTRHPGAALHRVADRATAHLHGACVGAGIEIPAFARHVTARQDTTFRLPELGLGLVPGAGGTVSLPRRIGRHRTAWLALTGTTIDADTALSWNLVDTLPPHDDEIGPRPR